LIADGLGCTKVIFLSFACALAPRHVVKTAGMPRLQAAITWRRFGWRVLVFMRFPP
jgi:hypothetical protein